MNKTDEIEAMAKKAAAPGNAAAMRETLVRVRDWLKRMNAGALQALAVSQITPAGAVNRSASGLIEDNDFYISVCDAALAAPPRNCDKASEWLDLYVHFKPPKGMREMPPEWVDSVMAFCKWLVSEGGAE